MPTLPGASLSTPESRARLLEALLGHAKEHGVTVANGTRADEYGGGLYSREDRTVHISDHLRDSDQGLSTLAHELGHAEFDQTVLGRGMQSPLARGAAKAAPVIGVLIALAAGGSFQRRLAFSAGATALLQAPLLGSEITADVKGHRMLKEMGATPQQLALHRSEARRGVSTYTTPGLQGLGASLLTSGLAAGLSRS